MTVPTIHCTMVNHETDAQGKPLAEHCCGCINVPAANPPYCNECGVWINPKQPEYAKAMALANAYNGATK